MGTGKLSKSNKTFSNIFPDVNQQVHVGTLSTDATGMRNEKSSVIPSLLEDYAKFLFRIRHIGGDYEDEDRIM
jgi:hypothetical protein